MKNWYIGLTASNHDHWVELAVYLCSVKKLTSEEIYRDRI
jgi:hypothetical protein